MNDFLQMDIFFFITSLVVVVVGVLLAMVLFRVWKIMGHMEEVSRDISAESLLLRHDVARMREHIKNEGFKFTTMITFARTALTHLIARKKK